MEKFKLIKLAQLENILDSNESSDKPIVVVFKWEECGICKVNVPLIEKTLTNKFPNQTYNYWIDVDSENIWAEDQLNSRWMINLAPTYHVYDKNKKLVYEHTAFLAGDVLEDVLKKIQ